ncbi:MAG TPA: lipid A deacylase LpxR family protein [Telluria sp.]|nr:lipid A deacylase LpxR family protein [Telluria sp.]
MRLLALAAALGTACAAHAADQARFLTFENDLFFHTDRYYTNGIQVAARQAGGARPDWLSRLCGGLGCAGHDLAFHQHNLGQLMYTPADIDRAAPQPWDHPWAGLLYYQREYWLAAPDRQSLTALTWQLGVTGRPALAAQSQRLVHRILGRPAPQGWDNQIGASLAGTGTLERRHALPALRADWAGGVQLRAAAYWRVALGTIQGYAGTGLLAVLGKALPDVPAGPVGILTKLAPPAATPCLARWLRCTAFLGIEARAMAYNVFLDGRLQGDDPSVARRVLVGDAVAGLRLDFPRSATRAHGPWFLQFKATRRSPEFRSPRPVASQSVGALSLGTDF